MYYTVEQASKELNISKQAIYKQLRLEKKDELEKRRKDYNKNHWFKWFKLSLNS